MELKNRRLNVLAPFLAGNLMLYCGGSTSTAPTPVNDQNSDVEKVQTFEKRYRLTTDTCDTGEQAFTAADQHQLMLRYCGALVDEGLNQDCARSMRIAYFKQECLDYQQELGIALVPDDGTIEKAPESVSVIASKTALTRIEAALLNLWVDRISSNEGQLEKQLEKIVDNDLGDSVVEEFSGIIAQSEIFLSSLTECGLQFSGPLCVEYQQHRRQNASLMKLGEREVYVYEPAYSALTNRFALVFEINQVDKSIYSRRAHIYVFTAMGAFTHFDKNPDAYTRIASLEMTPLTVERALELIKKPASVHQMIHLGNWIGNRDLAPDLQRARRLIVYDIYKSQENALVEEANGDILISFLDSLKTLVSTTVYIGELEHFTASANQTLAQEASIRLLWLNPKRADLVPLLSLALRNENKNIVYHAIDLTLNANLTFPAQDRRFLIPFLADENQELADKAYAAIIKIGVVPEMLENLERIVRSGKNIPAMVRAYRLIDLIASPEARQALVKYISNFKDLQVRQQMIELVDKKSFADQDIPVIKANYKSAYRDVILKTTEWLLRFNNGIGLTAIIESIQSNDWQLRNYLLGIVDENKSKINEGHLTVLSALFKTFYSEVHLAAAGLIQLINSDNSTMVLIDNMSDPFEDVRSNILTYIKSVAIKDKFLPNLTIQLGSKVEQTRRAIPAIIGKLTSKLAIQTLIDNINNADEIVRQEIIKQLMPRVLTWDYVTGLKNQYTLSTFNDAKIALIQLIAKISDYTATRTLIELIAEPNPNLRAEIISQLNKKTIELSHIYYMRQAFTSTTLADVKIALVKMTAKLSGYSPSSALLEFMGDANPAVRIEAYAVLDLRKLETDWAVVDQLNLQMASPFTDVRLHAAVYAGTVKIQSALDYLKSRLKEEEIGAKDSNVIAAMKASIKALDPDGNGKV